MITIDQAIEQLNYIRDDEGYSAAAWTALRMGAEALERSKWIPVTERLPETPYKQTDKDEGYSWFDSDWCLICTNKGRIAIAMYTVEGDSKLWSTEYGDYLKVIAWMPLPESYQEDEL